MRSLKLLALLPLAFLVACDSDGDGLSNSEEEELGTDPDLADTDGDGLDDAAEVEFGSDPTAADVDGDGLNDKEEMDLGTDPNSDDSDGDGYTDGIEVQAGTDPADAESMIYHGGWPWNPDKESLGAPDISSASNSAGELFAGLIMMDQHGDMVDIYDFFGQGVPVAIDISAEWCGPCRSLSEFVTGNGTGGGMDEYWPNVPTLIENGDMYWLTILGQDTSGSPEPSQSVLHNWDTAYPHPAIPVLSGSAAVAELYINYGWPSVYFMDETGEIIDGPDGTQNGHWDGLNEANSWSP